MDSEPLLYTGQSWKDIPRNVTHVKVDPSVTVVGEWAFQRCTQLIRVDLCEGMLERIDKCAFYDCTSLERITIPTSVIEVGESAFLGCSQLRNVELMEGLELIDKMSFYECTSLQSIGIPSTVKVIQCYAFWQCSHLMNVELHEGLERIEHRAFSCCTSLERITIPSTVKVISGTAFEGCISLEEIECCEQIEHFVNNVSLHWWNHGVSGMSLRTYSFLVQYNILLRMDVIKIQMWKNNIHAMLQLIPTMISSNEEEEENDAYFFSIRSRLSMYEHLQDDVAPLLELALWKSKMSEKSSGNLSFNAQMKLQCRCNSLSMVSIIIPNVLSFF